MNLFVSLSTWDACVGLGPSAFNLPWCVLNVSETCFPPFQTRLQPCSPSHSYHLTAELAVWNPRLFRCCSSDWPTFMQWEALRAVNITYKTGVVGDSCHLFIQTHSSVVRFACCDTAGGWVTTQKKSNCMHVESFNKIKYNNRPFATHIFLVYSNLIRNISLKLPFWTKKVL